MRPRPWHMLLVLFVAALVWPYPGDGQSAAPPAGEWRSYGNNEGSTRYSPLDQINRDNVKNLQVAWTWKFDNFGTPAETVTTETTPLMVNGVLYFTAGAAAHRRRRERGHRRDAVDVAARRGRALRSGAAQGASRRGLLDRRPNDERIVVVTPGFQLVSLDAKTGQPARASARTASSICSSSSTTSGAARSDRQIGNSSPPVISNDVIVVGPALTGRQPREQGERQGRHHGLRRPHRQEALDVPHDPARRASPATRRWQNDSADYTGNAGVWGPFSADPQLGLRLPADRVADQRRLRRPSSRQQPVSDSLVCLDIKTGKMIWYQQLVHHDIWDYDMPPHPILLDLTVDGKPDHAVVQLTKQAFAYVFDRTQRPAGVADGRAAGAADRRARGVDGADAAVPDQAAGLRPAGRHARRSDRLHAGAARRSDQGDRELSASARSTRRRTVVMPNGNRGTIVVPGSRRRRQLARRARPIRRPASSTSARRPILASSV